MTVFSVLIVIQIVHEESFLICIFEAMHAILKMKVNGAETCLGMYCTYVVDPLLIIVHTIRGAPMLS